MKIVIDIDDNLYDLVKQFETGLELIDKQNDTVDTALLRAIIKGIPLPKNHGRLKDIDAFITKVQADRKHSIYLRSWTADDVLNALDYNYAPTIIEADKENTDEEE